MDKKEAIMNAALALFAERGFHGTSVALIAEKAGVGAGTIYRYFKDKEVLVNALFQHWKLRLSQEVLSGLEQDLPPRQLFHEAWRRMFQLAREHPDVMMFLEFHHHASYLDDQSRLVVNRIEELFFEFYETCRQQQITKDVSPRLIMAIVNGAFIGAFRSLMKGEIEDTPENQDLAEELCWEAIRR